MGIHRQNHLEVRYARGGVIAFFLLLLAACGGTPPTPAAPDVAAQAAGLIKVEAEAFSANTPRSERAWVLQSEKGASGETALQALPKAGQNRDRDFVRRSPRLDFEVDFERAGTYYVWVRGKALENAVRSSNSLHVGLNGKAVRTANRISGFGGAFGWSKETMDGERAELKVDEAGVHTLNVWMREDGFSVDALALTPDADFIPKGRDAIAATVKPQILVGDASRRNAQLLQGQTLSGEVYIRADSVIHPTFGKPYKVQFLIDGDEVRTERAAPYDLRGGGGTANPYDTAQLGEGAHRMQVKAFYGNDRTASAYAEFTVANGSAQPEPTPTPVAPKEGTLYVSCRGDDGRSGTSPSQAWRTLGRAERADLQPGGALLFERGCTWQGPLKAAWHGSKSQPIRIGAYGGGAAPIIQNASQANVRVTGTHLLIEDLETRMTKSSLPTAVGCDGQPYGWRVGFAIDGGASHITLDGVKASRHTAGVHISAGAHHNRVLRSTLVNNTVMSRLNRDNPDDDSGAWGLLLNGDDNEVAYNTFSGNKGCSFDYGADGASIEVYKAKRNVIRHNVSQDQVFSELGGRRGDLAKDNRYSYNLFYTDQAGAEFLIVRGSRSGWGPTLRTEAFHNTVYLPNRSRTQGVVCHGGCSAKVLSLKNNILWVGWKTIFADAPFDEAANIYWRSGGDPLVQLIGFDADKSSAERNPMFRSASGADFSLRTGSPAINAARSGYTLDEDLTGRRTPRGGAPDIGAFEY